ncbi:MULTISPECIES: hypothetical protein [unclassified Paenibacillus]|uniref:hypothetical protein n=1 Tax=unclassified Paenibacillus TaxID=185978 RepID=UPI00278B4F97|nr:MULTISPECIES: hypothetical protein [unclassified Paenibacillus]MDQ0896245.1 hypothetical protein [Paenibacillus sp. V4I7]MDQ0913827.1 hypothetical protein [Paenibacillus sp. V4I5]
MVHILEETALASQFANFIWKSQSLSHESVTMGLECEKLPFDVDQAIVIGLSRDGKIDPSTSKKAGGRPDAYFCFKEIKKVILLEVKIAANTLDEDQLTGHYGICNASKLESHATLTWDEVLTFFQDQMSMAFEGSKNHYLLKNFLEFARLESLGIIADHESFFARFGMKEEIVRCLHNHFISQGFNPEFYNTADPRTMEYRKKRKSTSHVAIDLKHNRIIYKFGKPKYKEDMERRIKNYFGINYIGTYFDEPSQANLSIDLITLDNVQDAIALFNMSNHFRTSGE